MDPAIIIMIAAFTGVLALVFGLYSAFKGNSDSTLEARLAAFTAPDALRDGAGLATVRLF